MKFTTTLLTLASAASLASANPTPTLEKRADFCGQWDSQTTGSYIVYNNLWGQAAATSGSQCTGIDSLKGNTLAWHTKWSWTGGQGSVKSFANVVTTVAKKPLSSIKSLAAVWNWKYTGTNMVADVAFDLFTSSTATGDAEYEIMIWLAALGGAGPISSTGQPIATATLAGNTWKLYEGPNGKMKVFSFVAEKQVNNFKSEVMDFVNYLVGKEGFTKNQVLTSVGAGTEPFSGNNGVMTTSAFSLVQK